MDLTRFGWLGVIGITGLLGVLLDDPRWFGLFGLFVFYCFFALKKSN